MPAPAARAVRRGLGAATTGWGAGSVIVSHVPLARDDCVVYVGLLLASLHRAIWSEP